ncbi:MAG TPA: phenylalanine--tRNA ligase beta subunit-related protein [Ktedonobacterales bacterium]
MTSFRYAPEILTRYPNVVGSVILARDMRNGPAPDGLQSAYRAEQEATLRRIGETPLSQIDSLAAWRSVFRGFGVDPTQYRSAAEALLRRLTKKGDIPSINTLVDIGNLVSIRYALPVAIFDTRAIQQPIAVRFADGSEAFTTLGQSEQEHPEPGEAIFADERGLVVARRWCWRQSEESAAQLDTTAAIITVEAHHERGRNDVRAAIDDLLHLLRTYAGGQLAFEMLDEGHAAI